jgi:hypothetical protein
VRPVPPLYEFRIVSPRGFGVKGEIVGVDAEQRQAALGAHEYLVIVKSASEVRTGKRDVTRGPFCDGFFAEQSSAQDFGSRDVSAVKYLFGLLVSQGLRAQRGTDLASKFTDHLTTDPEITSALSELFHDAFDSGHQRARFVTTHFCNECVQKLGWPILPGDAELTASDPGEGAQDVLAPYDDSRIEAVVHFGDERAINCSDFR